MEENEKEKCRICSRVMELDGTVKNTTEVCRLCNTESQVKELYREISEMKKDG